MKDYELQNPKREYHRRSKAISQHAKQPQKISKKCVNSVFTSGSGDAFIESPTDSMEFFPISKIYDQLGDSAESFIASPDPLISPSSNTDLTESKSCVDNNQEASDIVKHINSTESKSFVDIASIEAEMVGHHLKQAQVQVMNSTNFDLQSKKLLDALIDSVIEEFHVLPEEKDQFAHLVSLKTRIVFTSFFLWILLVCIVILFSFPVGSSFNEPPPT